MDDSHPYDRGMVDLEVLGIRVLGGEDSPVLLLNESGGHRLLPIWIGHVEAAAIALQLTDDQAIERPLTHDLLAEVIHEFAGEATGRAIITEMDEGIFKARIRVLDLDVDARPSDAVALALKLGWSVQCPRALMDQVGVEVDELPSDEVDEFRAFLDSVNADDFSEEENG
ncbi:bifunctional nuclease family protein [Tessaracoccus oleiagri]|uniref:BFN domain-containing protein n=1 Tax=Tessaracoccus oleiagri TaxID=686624 RepID=A0A1G9MIH7_9ACTN|nr:bifunctional nuclease family protein [Tessaracoccus oleiagri]SDL74068.1 hypothetical protein SAMN04488242_2657 [Tessaracoccus oleiagri]